MAIGELRQLIAAFQSQSKVNPRPSELDKTAAGCCVGRSVLANR